MKNQIKEEIVKCLHGAESYVSFIQIENYLKQEGIPYEGEYSVHIPDHPTIMMWQGMSQDFARAILELLFEDFEITPTYVPQSLYTLEGKEIDLPIAENLHYEDTIKRWKPVMFKRTSLYKKDLISK
ncbi:hypothetical protein Q4S57_29305 [Priestia megaterium]|uniref:hypothetical protein n=1 Tax=Priestia megaterium TaxID=1404 RepID=UPI0026E19388|nr:hypothetical protein [Priestia megaterium]MDO6851926.1 hypothetical protein [Priestia megaterium]